MKSQKVIAFAVAIFVATYAEAGKIKFPAHSPITPVTDSRSVLSGCSPATAQTDLDINNVRATILNGGDMWWDLISGQYEIPKGSGITSLFAGSLWIGGIDGGGNLKVAAMTYRQGGNDFWPG